MASRTNSVSNVVAAERILGEVRAREAVELAVGIDAEVGAARAAADFALRHLRLERLALGRLGLAKGDAHLFKKRCGAVVCPEKAIISGLYSVASSF